MQTHRGKGVAENGSPSAEDENLLHQKVDKKRSVRESCQGNKRFPRQELVHITF